MGKETRNATIVVSHEEGVRFAAHVRSHRIIVDQSIRGGGLDSAPSPIELLGASLGSCVAFYVQQFCLARGLSFQGLRVEVEQKSAQNPNRVVRFDVRVVMPEPVPEQYAAMLARVVRSCPAHNTLTQGAEVMVAIEDAATVGL